VISCTPTAYMCAYREVTLVANEHDGHVGVGMLPGIVQPAGQVVESLTPASADVRHRNTTCCDTASQVVAWAHGLCTAADQDAAARLTVGKCSAYALEVL